MYAHCMEDALIIVDGPERSSIPARIARGMTPKLAEPGERCPLCPIAGIGSSGACILDSEGNRPLIPGRLARPIRADTDRLHVRGRSIRTVKQPPGTGRPDRMWPEADRHRLLQVALDRAHVSPRRALERADPIARHVLVRIVQEGGQARAAAKTGLEETCYLLHKERVFRHGQG